MDMEEKKPIRPDGEIKDELLDKVAGGGGGAPKPTATPTLDQKKSEILPYGKRAH